VQSLNRVKLDNSVQSDCPVCQIGVLKEARIDKFPGTTENGGSIRSITEKHELRVGPLLYVEVSAPFQGCCEILC
jgi:hypothetical protein